MEDKSGKKNYTAFSFISLKQSCYIEATGSGHLLGKFFLLIKHTNNAEGFDYLLEAIQQNTPALKLTVDEFLNQYAINFPALNGFKSFLNLLPEDHYFLIVGGKVSGYSTHYAVFWFLDQAS